MDPYWTPGDVAHGGRRRSSDPKNRSERGICVCGSEESNLAGGEEKGDWPHRARVAFTELGGAGETEDASAGVQLLGDVRGVLDRPEADRIASVDLLDELHGLDESPWGEWGKKQQPISQRGITKLLKPYTRSLHCDLKGPVERANERRSAHTSESDDNERPSPRCSRCGSYGGIEPPSPPLCARCWWAVSRKLPRGVAP
jgi:Protein of unknown function (DUF3631)